MKKGFELHDEVHKNRFRVSIFGSARIKPNNKYYREVVDLAYMLGDAGIDVVSGGGPGIMEAANFGHEKGRSLHDNNHTVSYGLTIKLPKEQRDNKHFDMKKDFTNFTKRLDTFVQLSNAVVVATGGVGTLLEFLYAWQLVQVEKIYDFPIIMLGDQWPPLIEWIKKGPLKHKLLNADDLKSIYLTKNSKEAFKVIKKHYDAFKKTNKALKISKDPFKANWKK